MSRRAGPAIRTTDHGLVGSTMNDILVKVMLYPQSTTHRFDHLQQYVPEVPGSDHTACVSTSASALWNHNQQHHCHRCRTNPLIPVAARYWNAPENTTAASKIRNNTDYWASNNQRVVAVTTKAATMVTTSMMIMMITAVVVNHWNVVRSILRLV